MIAAAFRPAALVLCLSSAISGLRAQAPAAEPPAQPEPVMSFEEYEPRSTLVVPEHPVTRARFPADEYFPYYRKRHAFWSLYGLDLPDEVLKKIYYKNALRILPGIDPSLFPE